MSDRTQTDAGAPPGTWAIVGGGFLGMTLAWRLAGAGHRVTLYDAAPELGGLASAWQLRPGRADGAGSDGDAPDRPVTWDRHYHVTLLSDLFTRGLLAELGLEREMRWVSTRTGFFNGERLAPLSSGLDFLRLPGLSLVSKMRLAATIVRASRLTDWRRLEQTRVEDWLVRSSGRATFDRLWRPLLQAKLGEAWREASAAFIWATIQRLYAARRTGLKREMFGYVPGGYARVIERFADRLRGRGVTLQLGAPVTSVVPRGADDGGGVRVEANGAARDFDRCVITTSPRVAARVCPAFRRAYAERLESVAYQGIVCASLLLRRPLAGHYLTYLTGGDLPFTAVVEMTAFVDPAELDGHTLVYLPRYCPPSDRYFALDDATIRAAGVDGLARIYPGLTDADVRACRVSRVGEVFPLPVLGASQKLPAMETGVPGVSVVSSAHIVNGTLNVNETVRLAEAAARALIAGDALPRAEAVAEDRAGPPTAVAVAPAAAAAAPGAPEATIQVS